MLQQHSLGGAERQLWVVTQGWSLMNPTMCHLYWNGNEWDGDEWRMPCQLRDFLHNDGMNASQLQMVMNDIMCLTCSLFCFPLFFWLLLWWMGLLCRWGIFFFFIFLQLFHSHVAPCTFLVLFLNCSLGPFFLPPTEIFLPCDHPTQLLGSHIKKFACLFHSAPVWRIFSSISATPLQQECVLACV